MPGTNEILPFALDPASNTLSTTAWKALAARETGFQSGTAKSAELNKCWRQSAFVAAGLAQWIANRGLDVLDDADMVGLVATIQAAQHAMISVTLDPGVPRTLNPLTEANYPAVRLTGYLNVATEVIVPASVSSWTFLNDTTGAADVTIKTASGGGAIVPRGSAATMVCDGTNVRPVTSDTGLGAGTIVMTARQAAEPGWLFCRGQLVSRTTYAALFAAIGTSYGPGDGVSTFALPDMRGMVPRGFDAGRGVDINRVFGTSQDDDIKAHTHIQTVYSANANPGNIPVGMGIVNGEVSGSYTTKASGGVETRMKNVVFNFQIKF